MGWWGEHVVPRLTGAGPQPGRTRPSCSGLRTAVRGRDRDRFRVGLERAVLPARGARRLGRRTVGCRLEARPQPYRRQFRADSASRSGCPAPVSTRRSLRGRLIDALAVHDPRPGRCLGRTATRAAPWGDPAFHGTWSRCRPAYRPTAGAVATAQRPPVRRLSPRSTRSQTTCAAAAWRSSSWTPSTCADRRRSRTHFSAGHAGPGEPRRRPPGRTPAVVR